MSEENGNGRRYATFLISIVSALGGGVGGALAAGIWLGSTKAVIDTHINSPEIHQSRSAKEGIAQSVIDREVKPILERMQRQLDRIEGKLDMHN